MNTNINYLDTASLADSAKVAVTDSLLTLIAQLKRNR